MFIPNLDNLNGKDVKNVDLEEIVNTYANDALSKLLISGGEGLKHAIAFAVGTAYTKGLLEADAKVKASEELDSRDIVELMREYSFPDEIHSFLVHSRINNDVIKDLLQTTKQADNTVYILTRLMDLRNEDKMHKLLEYKNIK